MVVKNMTNITETFLDSIKAVEDDIPNQVLNRARKSLLDYLAVTCAGSKFQEEKLKKYYEFVEPEEGNYKVIGMGKNLALKESVFLNGLNAHALDFDDGTNSGIIHLGSPIFSLLLPLAQKYNIKNEDILRAAIIGYETSYTMAVSIQPGHKKMGYHATGTCGLLGATLAAAYMLNFTEEERFQAFASAVVASSGMLKVLDGKSELKPYNVAKASLLSLTALHMAKAGFKGDSDPLGGRGFIKMMTGKESVNLKPTLLNGTYAIMKSYTKPYASCRYTHPSVEAAIRLKNKYQLKADEIKHIDIRTYDLAVFAHNHVEIASPYSAKMSIPYAVSVGLIYGSAGLREFSENTVRNKKILELTRKVCVNADKDLSQLFPNKQTAVVSVTTLNGVVEERVDFPKGEPENPLTDDEFKDRYSMLMDYAEINEANSNEIYDIVYRENSTVNEMMVFL